MAKQVMPEATLEPRDSDLPLPDALYLRLGLFAQLKSPPSLDKFPGTIRLRFYREGEEICRHGEAGWTAFYILTSKDVTEIRPERSQEVLASAARTFKELEAKLADPAVADKERKELQKKVDAAKRELEKLQALQRELEGTPGLLSALATRLPVPQPEAEQARLREQVKQAFAAYRREVATQHGGAVAERLDEHLTLEPAQKRRLADQLQSSSPDLADCLRDLAWTEDGIRRGAVACLPVRGAGARATEGGFLARLGRWFRKDGRAARTQRLYLPFDGPRDLPYDTQYASLYEGEVFGEMSCLNRAPRSATVLALRDSFVVEFLRNILEQVRKDAAYRSRLEAAMRRRLAETVLPQIHIFSGLDERQLFDLAGKIDFLEVPPGCLICDQHERADDMYIIAGGTVKVMVQASWLLNPDEIEAASLHDELAHAAAQAGTPAHHVLERLPQEVKTTLAKPAGGAPVPTIDLVLALNDLLRDPSFHREAVFAGIVDGEQLGRKAWTYLAGPQARPVRFMRRLNRIVLETVCKPALSAGKNREDNEERAGLVETNDISDWKALAAKLAGDDKKEGDPARDIWLQLSPAARDLLKAAKTAELSPDQENLVVADLNATLSREPLLLVKSIHQLALSQKDLLLRIKDFLPDGEAWSDYVFHRGNRAYNRLVLDRIFPSGLARASRPTGPPIVLVYHGSGEAIGEMGLAERKPRNATCITLSHAQDDPGRELGPVQLFRLARETFDELLATIPAFQARVAEIVARKHAQTAGKLAVAGSANASALQRSEDAERLRLMQGQKLMLIDLDRCTRCDECVKACVSTHDDGHSRLFLVGPRFDHYLVPATCRACLDPVCMIGCPVGSIHRGNSRQIVIEDWCIGCGLCADQCPYGSIQMHDAGVFPEGAHGWKLLPEDAAIKDASPEAWTRPGYADRKWFSGQAPFRLDRNLRKLLRTDHSTMDPVFCFRLPFRVDAASWRRAAEFTLNVTSADDAACVWLNGVALAAEEKPKRGKRDFVLHTAKGPLRQGTNLLAVRVRAVSGSTDVLLDARLDEVRAPRAASADITIKQVTHQAVVCDLCSSLPTGPACVHACPHEAASRFNAAGDW